MQSYTPNCFNVMQRCFTSHFSWKYLIKSNLTKSFFPINVAKNSIPYLSTVNPFQRHPCLSKIGNGDVRFVRVPPRTDFTCIWRFSTRKLHGSNTWRYKYLWEHNRWAVPQLAPHTSTNTAQQSSSLYNQNCHLSIANNNIGMDMVKWRFITMPQQNFSTFCCNTSTYM